MTTKELKADIETIKDKVRKPLSHREKLELLREASKLYFINKKEPITEEELFNWVKIGFASGA